MKKKFIRPNRENPETVTIEQMFICIVDVTEDGAMIGGSGLTPDSDFSLYCNHAQLQQILNEGDRHPQGLKGVAERIRAKEYCMFDLGEPVFINNMHLVATAIEVDGVDRNCYLLDHITVANSNDNDRIWMAYTANISNEYLCSYFLGSSKHKSEQEPLSDSLLLRIAYMEFRKTFTSVDLGH
jgi:hypothetical protein